MGECFFAVGAVIVTGVGVVGVGLALMCALDWAIGKIGRYVKSYGIIFEYAFYRREFMQWRKEVKGKAEGVCE